MKNVLITGGNGFIGNHLKQYLSECNVIVLSRSNTGENYICKDVKDIKEEDLKNIDEIYHLASTVDNYNIHSDPYLDINTNIIGTVALLEACKNLKIKIVYVSTFFVHGNPKFFPASVNDKEEPLGTYGATKLCAEHLCKVYSNVYNMDIKIARLSNVYGSGDQFKNNKKSAFVRMVYLALTNQPIKLYDGGIIKRDYVHVFDVVSALRIIMSSGTSGKIYYVGNGVGVDFKTLVNTIVKLFGGKVENINPPEFHKQVGIDDFWCDIKDLLDLGWKPKIDLEIGLIETANYIKKEISNG